MPSSEDDKIEEKKDGLNGNRIFLTKAFLVEVEKKTFGLFKSVVIETPDGRREKVKDVGPIDILRECQGNETPDLETFHPTEMRPMKLMSLTKKKGLPTS